MRDRGLSVSSCCWRAAGLRQTCAYTAAWHPRTPGLCSHEVMAGCATTTENVYLQLCCV